MIILLKKYQFFALMVVLSGVAVAAFSLTVSELLADEGHRAPASVESAGIWGSGLGLTLQGDERQRSSGGESEGELEAIRDRGSWQQGRDAEGRRRCGAGGCDDADEVRDRRSSLRRSSGGTQLTLAEAIAELLRQHGAVQTVPVGSGDASEHRRSSSRGSGGSTAVPDEEEPEYANLREYLVDVDEPVSEVRGVVDILADPSNIVPGQEVIDLLA